MHYKLSLHDIEVHSIVLEHFFIFLLLNYGCTIYKQAVIQINRVAMQQISWLEYLLIKHCLLYDSG